MIKILGLIAGVAISTQAIASEKMVRDFSADEFITADFSILCNSSSSLDEALKAAGASDTAWLKQLDCVQPPPGLTVKLIEPTPWWDTKIKQWKVRAPTKDGVGVTVYTEYLYLRWPDGNRIDPHEFNKPQ